MLMKSFFRPIFGKRACLAVLGCLGAFQVSASAEEVRTYSFFKFLLPENPTVTYAPQDLGVCFTTLEPGTIIAIRHYKSPKETGEHIGRIYGQDGKELATVTFTNETESGWQEAFLQEPLPIRPNHVYTICVNINKAFPSTWAAFRAKVFEAGPLRTVPGLDMPFPANNVKNNGPFSKPGRLLPVKEAENTNYFRDIVFVPAPKQADDAKKK